MSSRVSKWVVLVCAGLCACGEGVASDDVAAGGGAAASAPGSMGGSSGSTGGGTATGGGGTTGGGVSGGGASGGGASGGGASGGGTTGGGPTGGGPTGGGPTGGGTAGPCTVGLSGSRDRTVSVVHQGQTRTAQVHLPPGWDGRSPRAVVLNFHGRNSTPAQQALLSGMNALGDASGFISVHPQGIGNTWNAGLCCGEAQSRGIDDVGFAGALLDALEASVCVDSKRVYATGLSNGGFMAHRLGCELSSRIAAIAPVAGTNLTSTCRPSRAVPVLHMHGSADLVVPYGGFAGIAGVDETMAGWAQRDGCASMRSPLSQRGDVTCEQWTGCRDSARVQLCRVEGGGHQWPGGLTIPGLGNNSMELDASEAAWAFFRQHALP